MDVAIIGLGRMGAGVAERLLNAGHRVVVSNRTPEKADPLVTLGAEIALSLEEVCQKLASPRVIWMYLPAGEATDTHLERLLSLLQPGDTLIDGGNSQFGESIRHGKLLAEKQISFIDVGTSGGIKGRERGYCLMIGGEAEVVEKLSPLWQAVAQDKGWQRVGNGGAGHFVKMVHNAIEYGMMQSYAEGVDLMAAANSELEIEIAKATEVWQHGSIIESFLGELLRESIASGEIEKLGGRIEDSGEGRWAVEEGLQKQIDLPVITAALFARYQSRKVTSLGRQAVNALRQAFGGHSVEKHES